MAIMRRPALMYPRNRRSRRSEAEPHWYGSRHSRRDLQRSAGSLGDRAQPPVDHVFVRTNETEGGCCREDRGWAGRSAEACRAGGSAAGVFRPGGTVAAGREVLSALVASGLARRNGWTIAEQAGDRTPDKTQRLLNRAAWDTFAAMGAVRRFAVGGLDEAAARCRPPPRPGDRDAG